VIDVSLYTPSPVGVVSGVLTFSISTTTVLHEWYRTELEGGSVEHLIINRDVNAMKRGRKEE